MAGVSHDDGYLNDLKEFRGDQGEQITLVESYPARPGFMRLGLPIMLFPGVFRTKILPSHGANQPRRQSQEQLPLPSLQVAQDEAHDTALVGSDGYPNPVSDLKIPTQQKKLVSEILQGKRKGVLYNRNHIRLDRALKHPGGTYEPHQVSFERKKGQNGYCNDYYLGGECTRSGCTLTHDVVLEARELDVLRWLACKEYRCFYPNKCRNLHCYRLHACSPRDTRQERSEAGR